jgi:hypothetical protein
MSPDTRSNRSSERLLRQLDRIEERRDTLVRDLERLTEDERARRSDASVWSANEVVEHMVQAERYVLRALFDQSAPKDRSRSLRNRILHRVVIWILKGPIPVKVPARGMDPSGERSLDELVPEWLETHRRLREWLETRSADELREACFMHPVAGPLTAANAIEMLGTHLDRHAAQIRSRLGNS